MPRDLSLCSSFDSVANLYDEARPGYPGVLFGDLVTLTGIPAGGRILEIGCGPGTATVELARRGYSITAVEVGAQLVERARENCRAYPNVRIENVSFEDWPLEQEAFDVVASASAFHWVSPEVKFAKSAAALRPGGSIALFWNRFPGFPMDLRAALDEIYREEAPELAAAGHEDLETAIQHAIDETNASGLFGDVTVRRHPWTRRYTTEGYTKLLQTYSDHLALKPEAFGHLAGRIEALIRDRGGTIERPYLSVLYVAQLR